jgi:hypothetical protein
MSHLPEKMLVFVTNWDDVYSTSPDDVLVKNGIIQYDHDQHLTTCTGVVYTDPKFPPVAFLARGKMRPSGSRGQFHDYITSTESILSPTVIAKLRESYSYITFVDVDYSRQRKDPLSVFKIMYDVLK